MKLKKIVTTLVGVTFGNALLFLVTDSIGLIEDIPTPSGDPISLLIVIIASVVGVTISVFLFAILVHLFKVRNRTIIRVIGYGLLLLSFTNPFAIEDVTIGMVIVLNLMHVIVAVPMIEVLATLIKKDESTEVE